MQENYLNKVAKKLEEYKTIEEKLAFTAGAIWGSEECRNIIKDVTTPRIYSDNE